MCTMDQCYQVPDQGKEDPGDKVGGKEVEDCPGPGEVDGGNEKIFQNSENKESCLTDDDSVTDTYTEIFLVSCL